MNPRPWTALAVALGVTACGDTERDAESLVSRRDSAGTEIVTSAAPAWPEGSGWRLADAPDLVIGTAAGTDDQQLYRVTGAVTLETGSIAVANAGSHEVRFYDPAGALVAAVGGAGEGPGEFQTLSHLSSMGGDSVQVWDARARRLSRISASRGVLGETRLADAPQGTRSAYVGTVGGNWIVTHQEVPTGFDAGGEDVIQVDLDYWRYAPTGEPVAPIATTPGPPRMVRISSSNGQVTSVEIITPPFRLAPPASTTASGLLVASLERREVTYWAIDGQRSRIVRLDASPQPITPELVEAWVNRAPPPAREGQRALIDGLGLPDHLPAAQRVLVDAGGAVWLKRYEPDAAVPSVWTVIDDAGTWLGDVEMPARFSPHEIGNEFVLGTWTDDLDIEYVRRYAILR